MGAARGLGSGCSRRAWEQVQQEGLTAGATSWPVGTARMLCTRCI